jgi:predicted alpha-1,2-mannosidase
VVKSTLYFDLEQGEEVLMKIGISAVDAEGAMKNLDTEITDWDFEALKNKAFDVWNTQLAKVEVKGGTEKEQVTFYSALYHSFIAPNMYSDVDGRYRGRDLEIHQADHDYYTVFSLWDTYRTTHPLFTVLEEERTTDFINTFILQWQQGGLLPVWELSACETNCMIGNHAIPVIADAILKGIDGFDVEKSIPVDDHER